MANMPSYITTCWEHSADMAIRLYTALEQNVWLGDGVECMDTTQTVTTTREPAVLKKKDHALSLHKNFHFTEYFQNTNFQNRDWQRIFFPWPKFISDAIISTTCGWHFLHYLGVYAVYKRSLRLLVSLFGARTRTLSLSTTATAFSIISRLRIKPTIFYSW